jgi:hypothetical protein
MSADMTERGLPLKYTERILLDMLRERHANTRGIAEWVYMEHVRDDAGWYCRTIDALAMNTFQGNGLALHAYEVKCSRSDWLRELAEPAKSQRFSQMVDYFWLVAGPNVVEVKELPESWGLLLATTGSGLRQKRAASPLRPIERGWYGKPDPIPRGLVAAMLRAQIKGARV